MDPISLIGIVFAAASVVNLSWILPKALTSGPKGLSVVSEDEDPEVDIVFVHGLGGDPQETWCTQDKKKKINWMTDFLPKDMRTTTSTRILTFGYSQRLFSIPSYGFPGIKPKPSTSDTKIIKYLPQALYLNSRDLMEELTKARSDDARDRPIIFIAHSLGGLIVKSALVQASADIGEHSRHKAIQLSTTGVLFFGTPQRETPRKPWSKLLTRILTVSLDLPLIAHVETIKAQAELFDLQVQRYKSIEMNFKNYAFYESYMTEKKPSVEKKPVNLFVVPEESVLPVNAQPWWRKIRLERNHQNMVKFESRDDADYQIVFKCIGECISHSKEASARSSAFYQKLGTSHDHTQQQLGESSAQIDDPEVQCSIIRIKSWGKEQRLKDAEESLKEALERSEKENDGLSSGSTLELINQLAQYYVEKEEYSKAEQLYKRVFVVTQDLRGPWSLKTAAILQRIADVEIEQGHLAEATECLWRVEAIQDAMLRYGDPQTLSTRASIAILYDKQKQWQEAEKLYVRVIKERETYLDKYHEDTLKVMENLALSYRMRGKKWLTSAAAQYRAVLDRRKDILRREDGEMSRAETTVQNLARIYEDMDALHDLQKLRDDWPSAFRQDGEDVDASRRQSESN